MSSFHAPFRRLLALLGFYLMLTAVPASGAGKSLGGLDSALAEENVGRTEYGWEAMAKPEKVAGFFVTLLGAVGLAAALAYHPFQRRWSVEDLDQPKTIITYAVVGTVAALIVTPVPTLAYVIFGIGGLLRFRTDVGGTAKDTGRAILATIVGLACGMGFWLPAIYGTAIAWVLFAILESRMAMRVTVRGIKPEIMAESAVAYSDALKAFGCRVVSVRRNQLKGQIVYVMKVRRDFEPDNAELHLRETVKASVQGSVTWPEE